MASAFSSIRARWPKEVRRRDLVMDESGGRLVMRRLSAYLAKSCQQTSRQNAKTRCTTKHCENGTLIPATFVPFPFNWPAGVIGNESVPTQLAQCRFPGLAISNAKI